MRKIFKIVNHPLFSGSAIMIFGSNIVNALNYLYHLAMGRMLGPDGYGELAALISLIGLLGVIPGGITLAVTKFVASVELRDDADKLSSWLKGKMFQLSLIFSIIILVTSPIIVSFLHISNIYFVLLIAVSFLFSLTSLLNRAILQGLLKFKEMIISQVVEIGGKLGFSILLIFLGFNLGGAMISLVAAALIGWYLTNYYLNAQRRKTPESPKNLNKMMMFTIPVIVSSLSTTSLYTSDLILVKHFFSSYEAGIYAALATLGKIIFFGTGPIAAVMFPIISKRQAKGENFQKVFIFSFLATGFLSTCILMIYSLFPDVAIQLLFGSDYLGARNLLIWFGIVMSLFTLSSLLINYSLSLGRTKVVIFPTVVALGQIGIIWFYHSSLYLVVIISICVNALLLVSLLIYSIYGKRIGKGNTLTFSNSPGI